MEHTRQRKRSIRGLWKIRDVADLCQVSKETVHRWIQRGDLPALQLSKQVYRVREGDLEAFLRSRRVR